MLGARAGGGKRRLGGGRGRYREGFISVVLFLSRLCLVGGLLPTYLVRGKDEKFTASLINYYFFDYFFEVHIEPSQFQEIDISCRMVPPCVRRRLFQSWSPRLFKQCFEPLLLFFCEGGTHLLEVSRAKKKKKMREGKKKSRNSGRCLIRRHARTSAPRTM